MGLGLLGGVLEPVAAIVGGVCQAGRIIRSQVVVDGFPGDTTPGLACGGISFCLEHLFGDIGEEEEGGGGACECTITNGGQEEAKLVVGAAEDDFFEGGAKALNAQTPMLVTALGMLISVKLLQYWNA